VIVHREEHSVAHSISWKDESLVLNVYSNPMAEHEVLHNLHFLNWCGAVDTTDTRLELWVTRSDRRFAADALNSRGECVVFASGAGHPFRCWPIDRFAAVAKWLQTQYELTPVLLGASGDPEFDGGINLIGRTTLRQAAAVIERCVLFVGNDSGLMHIAAAVGTPIVEISGFRIDGDVNHANSPARFHPLGVEQRIVQPAPGPTLLAINEITVDAVCHACSELLTPCRRKARETDWSHP
jgi:ADP-heptose:LPS heptosyltransferase